MTTQPKVCEPFCETWCGKESDRLTWTVIRDGKVIRLCSHECWLAGRPVNPAQVKPKRNGPCPACGGTGGEGEWFDGCEVRCVDCGVMLMCDVAKDDGPTVFRLMNEGATDADE